MATRLNQLLVKFYTTQHVVLNKILTHKHRFGILDFEKVNSYLLVRVDLRKKGVLYRLFFGHFPNATAAVEAIKKYHFKDALVNRTRYACLLGSYPGVAQADSATRLLAAKGLLLSSVALTTCPWARTPPGPVARVP